MADNEGRKSSSAGGPQENKGEHVAGAAEDAPSRSGRDSLGKSKSMPALERPGTHDGTRISHSESSFAASLKQRSVVPEEHEVRRFGEIKVVRTLSQLVGSEHSFVEEGEETGGAPEDTQVGDTLSGMDFPSTIGTDTKLDAELGRPTRSGETMGEGKTEEALAVTRLHGEATVAPTTFESSVGEPQIAKVLSGAQREKKRALSQEGSVYTSFSESSAPKPEADQAKLPFHSKGAEREAALHATPRTSHPEVAQSIDEERRKTVPFKTPEETTVGSEVEDTLVERAGLAKQAEQKTATRVETVEPRGDWEGPNEEIPAEEMAATKQPPKRRVSTQVSESQASEWRLVKHPKPHGGEEQRAQAAAEEPQQTTEGSTATVSPSIAEIRMEVDITVDTKAQAPAHKKEHVVLEIKYRESPESIPITVGVRAHSPELKTKTSEVEAAVPEARATDVAKDKEAHTTQSQTKTSEVEAAVPDAKATGVSKDKESEPTAAESQAVSAGSKEPEKIPPIDISPAKVSSHLEIKAAEPFHGEASTKLPQPEPSIPIPAPTEKNIRRRSSVVPPTSALVPWYYKSRSQSEESTEKPLALEPKSVISQLEVPEEPTTSDIGRVKESHAEAAQVGQSFAEAAPLIPSHKEATPYVASFPSAATAVDDQGEKTVYPETKTEPLKDAVVEKEVSQLQPSPRPSASMIIRRRSSVVPPTAAIVPGYRRKSSAEKSAENQLSDIESFPPAATAADHQGGNTVYSETKTEPQNDAIVAKEVSQLEPSPAPSASMKMRRRSSVVPPTAAIVPGYRRKSSAEKGAENQLSDIESFPPAATAADHQGGKTVYSETKTEPQNDTIVAKEVSQLEPSPAPSASMKMRRRSSVVPPTAALVPGYRRKSSAEKGAEKQLSYTETTPILQYFPQEAPPIASHEKTTPYIESLPPSATAVHDQGEKTVYPETKTEPLKDAVVEKEVSQLEPSPRPSASMIIRRRSSVVPPTAAIVPGYRRKSSAEKGAENQLSDTESFPPAATAADHQGGKTVYSETKTEPQNDAIVAKEVSQPEPSPAPSASMKMRRRSSVVPPTAALVPGYRRKSSAEKGAEKQLSDTETKTEPQNDAVVEKEVSQLEPSPAPSASMKMRRRSSVVPPTAALVPGYRRKSSAEKGAEKQLSDTETKTEPQNDAVVEKEVSQLESIDAIKPVSEPSDSIAKLGEPIQVEPQAAMSTPAPVAKRIRRRSSVMPPTGALVPWYKSQSQLEAAVEKRQSLKAEGAISDSEASGVPAASKMGFATESHIEITQALESLPQAAHIPSHEETKPHSEPFTPAAIVTDDQEQKRKRSETKIVPQEGAVLEKELFQFYASPSQDDASFSPDAIVPKEQKLKRRRSQAEIVSQQAAAEKEISKVEPLLPSDAALKRRRRSSVVPPTVAVVPGHRRKSSLKDVKRVAQASGATGPIALVPQETAPMASSAETAPCDEVLPAVAAEGKGIGPLVPRVESHAVQLKQHQPIIKEEASVIHEWSLVELKHPTGTDVAVKEEGQVSLAHQQGAEGRVVPAFRTGETAGGALIAISTSPKKKRPVGGIFSPSSQPASVTRSRKLSEVAGLKPTPAFTQPDGTEVTATMPDSEADLETQPSSVETQSSLEEEEPGTTVRRDKSALTLYDENAPTVVLAAKKQEEKLPPEAPHAKSSSLKLQVKESQPFVPGPGETSSLVGLPMPLASKQGSAIVPADQPFSGGELLPSVQKSIDGEKAAERLKPAQTLQGRISAGPERELLTKTMLRAPAEDKSWPSRLGTETGEFEKEKPRVISGSKPDEATSGPPEKGASVSVLTPKHDERFKALPGMPVFAEPTKLTLPDGAIERTHHISAPWASRSTVAAAEEASKGRAAWEKELTRATTFDRRIERLHEKKTAKYSVLIKDGQPITSISSSSDCTDPVKEDISDLAYQYVASEEQLLERIITMDDTTSTGVAPSPPSDKHPPEAGTKGGDISRAHTAPPEQERPTSEQTEQRSSEGRTLESQLKSQEAPSSTQRSSSFEIGIPVEEQTEFPTTKDHLTDEMPTDTGFEEFPSTRHEERAREAESSGIESSTALESGEQRPTLEYPSAKVDTHSATETPFQRVTTSSRVTDNSAKPESMKVMPTRKASQKYDTMIKESGLWAHEQTHLLTIAPKKTIVPKTEHEELEPSSKLPQLEHITSQTTVADGQPGRKSELPGPASLPQQNVKEETQHGEMDGQSEMAGAPVARNDGLQCAPVEVVRIKPTCPPQPAVAVKEDIPAMDALPKSSQQPTVHVSALEKPPKLPISDVVPAQSKAPSILAATAPAEKHQDMVVHFLDKTGGVDTGQSQQAATVKKLSSEALDENSRLSVPEEMELADKRSSLVPTIQAALTRPVDKAGAVVTSDAIASKQPVHPSTAAATSTALVPWTEFAPDEERTTQGTDEMATESERRSLEATTGKRSVPPDTAVAGAVQVTEATDGEHAITTAASQASDATERAATEVASSAVTPLLEPNGAKHVARADQAAVEAIEHKPLEQLGPRLAIEHRIPGTEQVKPAASRATAVEEEKPRRHVPDNKVQTLTSAGAPQKSLVPFSERQATEIPLALADTAPAAGTVEPVTHDMKLEELQYPNTKKTLQKKPSADLTSVTEQHNVEMAHILSGVVPKRSQTLAFVEPVPLAPTEQAQRQQEVLEVPSTEVRSAGDHSSEGGTVLVGVEDVDEEREYNNEVRQKRSTSVASLLKESPATIMAHLNAASSQPESPAEKDGASVLGPMFRVLRSEEELQQLMMADTTTDLSTVPEEATKSFTDTTEATIPGHIPASRQASATDLQVFKKKEQETSISDVSDVVAAAEKPLVVALAEKPPQIEHAAKQAVQAAPHGFIPPTTPSSYLETTLAEKPAAHERTEEQAERQTKPVVLERHGEMVQMPTSDAALKKPIRRPLTEKPPAILHIEEAAASKIKSAVPETHEETSKMLSPKEAPEKPVPATLPQKYPAIAHIREQGGRQDEPLQLEKHREIAEMSTSEAVYEKPIHVEIPEKLPAIEHVAEKAYSKKVPEVLDRRERALEVSSSKTAPEKPLPLTQGEKLLAIEHIQEQSDRHAKPSELEKPGEIDKMSTPEPVLEKPIPVTLLDKLPAIEHVAEKADTKEVLERREKTLEVSSSKTAPEKPLPLTQGEKLLAIEHILEKADRQAKTSVLEDHGQMKPIHLELRAKPPAIVHVEEQSDSKEVPEVLDKRKDTLVVISSKKAPQKSISVTLPKKPPATERVQEQADTQAEPSAVPAQHEKTVEMPTSQAFLDKPIPATIREKPSAAEHTALAKEEHVHFPSPGPTSKLASPGRAEPALPSAANVVEEKVRKATAVAKRGAVKVDEEKEAVPATVPTPAVQVAHSASEVTGEVPQTRPRGQLAAVIPGGVDDMRADAPAVTESELAIADALRASEEEARSREPQRAPVHGIVAEAPRPQLEKHEAEATAVDNLARLPLAEREIDQAHISGTALPPSETTPYTEFQKSLKASAPTTLPRAATVASKRLTPDYAATAPLAARPQAHAESGADATGIEQALQLVEKGENEIQELAAAAVVVAAASAAVNAQQQREMAMLREASIAGSMISAASEGSSCDISQKIAGHLDMLPSASRTALVAVLAAEPLVEPDIPSAICEPPSAVSSSASSESGDRLWRGSSRDRSEELRVPEPLMPALDDEISLPRPTSFNVPVINIQYNFHFPPPSDAPGPSGRQKPPNPERAMAAQVLQGALAQQGMAGHIPGHHVLTPEHDAVQQIADRLHDVAQQGQAPYTGRQSPGRSTLFPRLPRKLPPVPGLQPTGGDTQEQERKRLCGFRFIVCLIAFLMVVFILLYCLGLIGHRRYFLYYS